MGRLRRPELPPGALADLVRELHALHSCAGRPSMRDLAEGQRFSHTTVHDLFTKTTAEPPRLPVLLTVVERLATIASRMNVEETLDRFDALWRAADTEPFEPVEQSATTAALQVEVHPDEEPATNVAAAEREPLQLWPGKPLISTKPTSEPFSETERVVSAASIVERQLTGHTADVRAVAAAQVDGRPVVVSGSHDGTVRVWDLATGRPIGSLLTGHRRGVRGGDRAAGRAPVVISGSDDKTVRVWDLATGRPVGSPFTGHTDVVARWRPRSWTAARW